MSNLSFLRKDGFKFTKVLDLGRFNEALAGQTLSVWLNLDRQWYADLARMKAIADENRAWLIETTGRIAKLPEDEQEAAYIAAGKENESRAVELNGLAFSVWARLWGCTPDEAAQLLDASLPLYNWCINTALDFVEEYKTGQKKSSSGT